MTEAENTWAPGEAAPEQAEAPELSIELAEAADPNDCVLVLNQAGLNVLTTAPTEAVHQGLLGDHIVQHLKDHHNYGSQDPEHPSINLRHEVR